MPRPRRPYENQRSPAVQEPTTQPQEAEVIDTPEDVYDEVEDSKLDPTLNAKPFPAQKANRKRQDGRPVLAVPPTSQSSSDRPPTTKNQKLFSELTNRELVERLTQCHMAGLAEMCEKNRLDGGFFKNVSDAELKKDFKLSVIDFLKLKQMRDENWVPST